MAATITTDADLMASGHLLGADKPRLTPKEWTDGAWTIWHTEAWSEIKRHLKNRAEPIEETDLVDSSELKPAAVRYVLYLAYSYNRDMDRAEHHLAGYRRAMTQINPTLTGGGEAIGWGRSIRMYRSS